MKLKFLLAAGAILLSGALYAQKPDGETPASEGVCDGLVDATPGLFGLCVAYCKAQDSGEPDLLDLTNPKQNILDAYNRRKTYDDPYMPCHTGCPCFSIEDAEFVASHQNFFRCTDYFEEEVRETYYESWQQIGQMGEFDENGDAQVSASVYALEADPGTPLGCNWEYKDVSPTRNIQRYWDSSFPDEDELEARRKFEHCQAIIEQTVNKYGLPCETVPECETRIILERPFTGEKPTLVVDGSLVNDPSQECANQSPIARVDWYWGDGVVDTFNQMPDGYVHPFPNSHTYLQMGFFIWKIYAFDENGKLIAGGAGGFYGNF